jgi:hypothetical protein
MFSLPRPAHWAKNCGLGPRFSGRAAFVGLGLPCPGLIRSKVLCGQSLVNPFYAYLNNVLTFYSISELCDFLLCCKNRGKAYVSKNIKNIKIIGLVYSLKFNMYTSLIENLHFLFFIVVLPSFFRMMPLFVLQIKKDFALSKVNICTFHCQYMYFLPSYLCTSLYHFILFSSTFTWNMHFQN